MKIDFKDLPVLRNATPCTIEALKSSGEINHGLSFQVGDRITFEDDFDPSKIVEVPVRNSAFKAKNIAVTINGEANWLPVGTLRRQPIDALNTLKPYPTNHKLYTAENDYERVQMCLGKTLHVTNLVEVDFPRFANGSALYENGRVATRKAMLPVFELR